MSDAFLWKLTDDVSYAARAEMELTTTFADQRTAASGKPPIYDQASEVDDPEAHDPTLFGYDMNVSADVLSWHALTNSLNPQPNDPSPHIQTLAPRTTIDSAVAEAAMRQTGLL